MTTTVNMGALRAFLTGRSPIWRTSKPTFLLRTSDSLSAGSTVRTATNPPAMYFHEEATFSGNMPAKLKLRGKVLFINTTITAGVTYYLVATVHIPNPATLTYTQTVLWSSSFEAVTSLSNDYLSLGYPNNIVCEV